MGLREGGPWGHAHGTQSQVPQRSAAETSPGSGEETWRGKALKENDACTFTVLILPSQCRKLRWYQEKKG